MFAFDKEAPTPPTIAVDGIVFAVILAPLKTGALTKCFNTTNSLII